MSDIEQISYAEFMAMARDPDVDEEDLATYLRPVKAEGSGFGIRLEPDPAVVIMSEDDQEAENAMSIGNGASRWRRSRRFKKSKKDITLVSEGDSWFQFPLLVTDVIDHLSKHYRIKSLGAAGDTAENIVFGDGEYLRTLRDLRDEVQAFLFSAAGNDVLGEDRLGDSVLSKLVRSGVSSSAPADHVDAGALGSVLDRLVNTYNVAVTSIRAIEGLENLPIVVHTYDYAIPGGFPGDPRDPIYASNDHWLGRPLTAAGITDPQLQRGIVKVLIDKLHHRFIEFADRTPGVHVVDIRGTLPAVEDWADEIHPTDDGFERAAEKFRAVLSSALATNGTST